MVLRLRWPGLVPDGDGRGLGEGTGVRACNIDVVFTLDKEACSFYRGRRVNEAAGGQPGPPGGMECSAAGDAWVGGRVGFRPGRRSQPQCGTGRTLVLGRIGAAVV